MFVFFIIFHKYFNIFLLLLSICVTSSDSLGVKVLLLLVLLFSFFTVKVSKLNKITLPGTRGTWRQWRLLCVHVFVQPCFHGSTVHNWCHCLSPIQFNSNQIFNATRHQRHIEAAPEKSGLVLP